MYLYRWPRKLWRLQRFLFGETWGEYMQRIKLERNQEQHHIWNEIIEKKREKEKD